MIGGDLLFEDYKYNINDINYHALIYHDKQTNPISVFSSVMVLLNCGISNDPFFLSYSFQTGVIQALVLCAAALILTQVSFHIFIKTWSYNSDNSYVSIWSDVFGKKLVILPRLLLLVAFISLSSVATNDFLTEYDDFIKYLDPKTSTVFSSKYFSKFVLTFCYVFPSLFHDRFSTMKYASYVGNFLLMMCLVAQIWLFVHSYKTNGFDPQKEIVYWSKDISQTIACFDLFNIVFFVAPFVSMVSKDVRNVTRSKILKITWITSLSSMVINLAGGYLGYLTYFSNTVDDLVFYSDSNQNHPAVIMGKFCCLIKTILSNNMFIYITAIALSDLIFPYSESHKAARVTSGMVIWLLTIFITYSGWKLTDLLNLIGSFSFIILAFVLPSVFYLSMYKFKKPFLSIVSIFEVLICVFISGTILYFNTKSFIADYAGEAYF